MKYDYRQPRGRRRPDPLNPRDHWRDYENNVKSIATSEYGQKLVELFEVPEAEEAEIIFAKALRRVSDKETRAAIDDAAGKLAEAYQILGFCAGHFSTDSRAKFYL